MRILFVSSEAHPFVKTGGLADVAGALPRTLREMGHDVRMVLPRYGDIDGSRFRLIPLMPEMKVSYGAELMTGSVLRCPFPGSDMPVYFIDEPSFSERKGIYGTGRHDFPDNDRRFAFFNLAVLWLIKGLDWQPEIIHLNDWQTGLIPALLRYHPLLQADPHYQKIRTLFAIHNMAYQGNFDKFLVPAIGLPWDVFTQDGMEFYGKASFLKAGINFSDAIVTVSPTYAREIQTETFGAGMDGALRLRSSYLQGILNGIDPQEWNPKNDKLISSVYTASNLEGKMICKAALQEQSGLPVDASVPLIGMVSRLVTAKGFEIVAEALDELLELPAQYVMIGSGEEKFENIFRMAAKLRKDKFQCTIGYDNTLAHRIIAGSDFFLMPSLFEPCGLTQMYSMTYGTLPIVRRTGGLSDSVISADDQQRGTGFLFDEIDPAGLVRAVKEAIHIYTQKRDVYMRLQQNAMAADWSWENAARRYQALYENMLE